MSKEVTCIGCGKLTTGSVGAAGIKWPNVCQPCKDEADQGLLAQSVAVGKMLDSIFTPKEPEPKLANDLEN